MINLGRKAYIIRCSDEHGQHWYDTRCSGKLCEFDRLQDAKAKLTKLRRKNTKPYAGPKVTYDIEPIYY
jgi:hypothetical protein